MGSQHKATDLAALMGYIEELENSLAKKDELLADKDQRIDSLEAQVATVTKSVRTRVASVSQSRAIAELVTPRIFRDGIESSPNQVSDESGEVELDIKGSLSHSLSRISQASDENSTTEDTTSDGRWNIPFDGSFEDLMAQTPPGKGSGHENALVDVSFVPIGEVGRGCSGRLRATSVRPLARSWVTSSFAHQRGPPKDATQEKENFGHKGTFSPGISTNHIVR